MLDRFGQIEPQVLFAADGYFYGGVHTRLTGQTHRDCRGVPSLRRVVVVPCASDAPTCPASPRRSCFDDFAAQPASGEIEFTQLPFDHPLYIMYSSGTTGVPKCIVHGAGGTLLQHLKEHQLHTDIHHGDVVFISRPAGWMMWNWLVSAFASGATLVLYDGSPFFPDGNALFDYADEVGITVFGVLSQVSLTPP